jgi:hypothetical protein
LERYGTITGYHLALTHLILSTPSYAAFYLERIQHGDYVFVDNSLIELGEAADMHKVIQAANMIGAEEIILPDVYMDRVGTRQAIARAMHDWAEYAYVEGGQCVDKLMIVPQGEHLIEWMRSYEELVNKWGPAIHSIGIPKNTHKFGTPEVPFGREKLIQELISCGFLHGGLEYHLLGCWDNPIEIAHLSKYEFIRGIDTCLPTLCGRLGIAFHPEYGLQMERPKTHMTFDWEEDNPLITEHNIMCMLRWANQ